jgi:hypothetical protein
MYQLYGYAEHGRCKECQHFKKYRYRDKQYQKCEIYGITNSEASDWVGKNPACGLFPDKQYKGDREVIRITQPTKKEDEQIPGQLSLF